MSHIDRPTQISAFLKTLSLEGGAESSAELTTYLEDLEAKQPDRPAQIAETLRSIGARYPPDIVGSLEAYIARLESSQLPVKPSSSRQSWDPANPPIWSHERSKQREHRRNIRAMQKLNNYR